MESIAKAISECGTLLETRQISKMIDAYEKSGGEHAIVRELRDALCDRSFELYFHEKRAGLYDKNAIPENPPKRSKPAQTRKRRKL